MPSDSDEGMEHSVGGTGAVFCRIVNRGDQADRLTSARADVADVVEIHETTIVDEVMTMRQVPGIDLPPDAEIQLKPGSYHIMLIGLRHDLNEGDRFLVDLVFEKNDPMAVEAEVKKP